MSCGVEHAPESTYRESGIDIDGAIDRIVQAFEAGTDRTIRFPALREFYGSTRLVATFSHLNPNLSIDEVYGNYVLGRVARRLGLDDDRIINAAYDNIHAGHDAPKGHRVQYVIVNVDVLDPEEVIHLQDGFFYDPDVVYKDGQNRIKSVPEQNIDAFRERYDAIDAILQRHSGQGDTAGRIAGVRRDFLRLLDIDVVPERPFSRSLAPILADVLERLYDHGYPFWEMPVPTDRERYAEHTFFVEGVDAHHQRHPTRFDGGAFVFDDGGQERRIPTDAIFDALRSFQVVPTMPLVILATATAPQMPHLGGRDWIKYAPSHVDAQAEWLGIDETSETLILTTEGHQPLVTYRYNQEFTGFPAVYLTYGPEVIRRALEDGFEERVEFKRIVF